MKNVTGTSAPRAVRPREDVERDKRAGLWSAVWEASQVLSPEQIRDVVEGTLREIANDEP